MNVQIMRIFKIILVLTIFNTTMLSAQTNRFSQRQGIRSTYVPKEYDGSNLVEMATKIYEARKARAINDCLVKWRETFESVVGEKNVVDQKEFVDSEWVRILHYIEIKDMAAMIVLTTRDGDKYLFKTNKEIFDNWIAAPSKGEFYHNFVKDNESMSMIDACEQMITSN